MELECTMDETDVIVMDNGSGYLKVGFSGEDAPRAVLPNAVAHSSVEDTKEEESHLLDSAASAKKSQTFHGEEALLQPGASVLRPVQRGCIVHDQVHEDAMENLWEHTFRSVLSVEQEELPILIADSSPPNARGSRGGGGSTLSSREWTTEVMFEKFKVRSLAIMNSAVLALFSTGRTRGLVVESGEGVTQAVPVFEGYAIPHAIFKTEIAGQDITAKMQEMMANHPLAGQFSTNYRTMQSMKEKLCAVQLPGYEQDAMMRGHDPSADEEARSFELPDGKIVQVGQNVRMDAPEILFSPEGTSIQKICMQAIQTCDLDFRQDLIRSMVVAGGTSMLPGLSQRLRHELTEMLPTEMARQVDVCVDSQRKYAAWIGGSMFASLSTFEHVVITKAEFEEGKADVRSLVARKTF